MITPGNIKRGTIPIILYLDGHEGCTLSAVHRNSGLGNVHTVYNRLGELVRSGLVVKGTNAKKRNASSYTLTDEGRSAAKLLKELGNVSPMFRCSFREENRCRLSLRQRMTGLWCSST